MTTFHGPDLASMAIERLHVAQLATTDPAEVPNLLAAAQVYATLARTAAALATAGTVEAAEEWEAALNPLPAQQQ